MKERSRFGTCCLQLLLPLALAAVVSLQGVAQDATSARKIVQRTAPAYPALAQSLALEGVVKIEAVVAPDGSVKDVAVKGGHPVLAQAAVNCVRRWRWEAAPHETRETVEVKFAPER